MTIEHRKHPNRDFSRSKSNPKPLMNYTPGRFRAITKQSLPIGSCSFRRSPSRLGLRWGGIWIQAPPPAVVLIHERAQSGVSSMSESQGMYLQGTCLKDVLRVTLGRLQNLNHLRNKLAKKKTHSKMQESNKAAWPHNWEPDQGKVNWLRSQTWIINHIDSRCRVTASFLGFASLCSWGARRKLTTVLPSAHVYWRL